MPRLEVYNDRPVESAGVQLEPGLFSHFFPGDDRLYLELVDTGDQLLRLGDGSILAMELEGWAGRAWSWRHRLQ